MDLSVRRYSQIDRRHVDLFRSTWGPYVDRGQGKMLDFNQLRGFYEENPGGSAVLAVATDGDQWHGAIAGIPTLFRTGDGTVRKAYQIGDFMVRPESQGKGVGRLLLEALSKELAAEADPVYTFPNRRSIRLFSRLGYVEVRRVALFGYSTHVLHGLARGRLGATQRNRLSLRDACDVINALADQPGVTRRPGLVKDGDFITWRYSRIRTASDYHFLELRAREQDSRSVIIWTPFTYRGTTIQVVVDSVSRDNESLLIPAAARDALRSGVNAGICNLDRDERPPLGAILIPTRWDPRPGKLLVPGGDSESMALALEARFVAGDWMGF